MKAETDVDYLVVTDGGGRTKSKSKNLEFNVFEKKLDRGFSSVEDSLTRRHPENRFDTESESSEVFPDITDLNFNVSNRKYLNPPYSKKSYLIPKIISSSIAIKNQNLDMGTFSLDFGISETINYKTQFPHSVNYERLCPPHPPYIAPLLIGLLNELEQHVPPISRITSGSSQQTMESADALFDTMMTVHINTKVPLHIEQIFYLNVTAKVLTNTLQVFFQRLRYPLFLATSEFCHTVTSNQHNIKLIKFGCRDYSEENEVIYSLTRCLAISSNYQIANLAYFVEICQRWMQAQIKYELDRKPFGRAEAIYEDAAANIALVFGKTIVGVPKTFVAQKIMDDALPLVDDIRRLILYFLLGIPPFEFWHLWSINSICFEDNEKRCKSKRGAFLEARSDQKSLEALPHL